MKPPIRPAAQPPLPTFASGPPMGEIESVNKRLNSEDPTGYTVISVTIEGTTYPVEQDKLTGKLRLKVDK